MPDSVWQSILDKGGIGGAIALALFFVLGGVIRKLWSTIEEQRSGCSKIQVDCDEKIRIVYERQITTLMELITTVNRILDKNTMELAKNTMVVESRAEAIRSMSDSQLQMKLVMDTLKDQFNRVERNQGSIMDGVAGRSLTFQTQKKD